MRAGSVLIAFSIIASHFAPTSAQTVAATVPRGAAPGRAAVAVRPGYLVADIARQLTRARHESNHGAHSHTQARLAART